MSNDEYIDYSCSTPLERLSRDVQSLLRGWHIISGSDRHVSFNRKQRFSSSPLKRHLSVPDLSSSKCTDSDYDDDDDNDNDNDNDAGSTGSPRTRPATAPIGRLSIVGETEVADAQNGTDQVTDCSSPPRKKPDETVLGTEHLTPLREIERPSPLRGHRRSRSEDTQYVDTLNFDLPSHSHSQPSQPSQPSQTLSPIRLNRVRSDNNSLNSPHRVKFASGGGVKLIRSGKLTLTTTPPNSAHRPQDRMTVELDLCLWDGPPIATTRSGYTSRPPPAASNLTSATIPLSLRTYRSPENGHKEVVEHEDIISNLSSLLGIGQHLTLTPANDDALNSLLDTTVDALLRLNHPSGTLAQRSKGKMRSPSKFLFSSSTIASASATKTTTSSDDGFTDADGNTIVLGPDPQDHVAIHSAALHSLSTQLQMALNIALGECDCRIPAFGIWGLYQPSSSSQHDNLNNITKKREYLMAVPAWMNGGNLLEIAEESSPCSALIRYLKEAEEEEEKRIKTRGNPTPPTISEDDNNDTDGATIPEDGTTTVRKTNRKQTRRRSSNASKLRNSISPASLIHNSLNLPSSSSLSSKQAQREGGAGKDRLYLPAFLMGYCHSGPSLLAKGATFAIHVVPAGISYPIHCTTLNSLGQLLLQHCTLPSVENIDVTLTPVPGVTLSSTMDSEDGVGPTREESEAAVRMREEAITARDLSFYGKVEVVWARHKYTWSKLFEFQQFTNGFFSGAAGGDTNATGVTVTADNLNVLTCNIPWRKCCDSGISSDVYVDGNDDCDDESSSPSTAVLEYRKQCRTHALKMIYRIMALTKSGVRDHEGTMNNSSKEEEFEPLWGPVDDPILSVSITVTWCSNNDNDAKTSSPTSSVPRERGAPFLTLPLRIRSQRTMSSQDVLEMENTLLSTIFNPLIVPPKDFSLLVTTDQYSRCNALGANNRCILAALIRVSTLETDALLGNITKKSVLQQMHDRKVGDDAAENLMKKARVGSVTQKLVEIMDWSSMAAETSEEDSAFEEKLDAIVKQIMDGGDMRCYPNPPEENGAGASHAGGTEFDFQKAESPGRLLSVLFSCMSGLRWPSAMARLWLKFITELRLRWEDRKSLQNLGRVPGLDPYDTTVNNVIIGGDTGQQFKTIGHSAKHAAFVHSSEPSPNLYGCLVSQKLQVFNIGVETMIVREQEEYRRQMCEEEARSKNVTNDEDDTADQDGDETDNKDGCAQSEVATEVIGNTCDGVNAIGNDNVHYGGIQEDKEWCAQSEAATDVIGNTRCSTKTSRMGDSQITTTDTTVSGGNSFPVLSPPKPFQSMAEIDEDDDSPSDNSIYSSDSRNVPMMFDPHENKFKPMADNDSGDIILNHQPPDIDTNSLGTGTFYDAFTSIETNTYDNRSRYVVSCDGENPEIEDDFDYEFVPFEEAAVTVANRRDRKGIRCPVHGAHLIASSDQVYAPYLQRPHPVTDEMILERRNLLTAATRYDSSSTSVKNRLEVAHRFEKAKLLSDMSAFKAANPGAIFHDFVLWYGNPENPLQLYDDEIADFNCTLTGEYKDKEAEEAVFILDQTRKFWSDTWDEADPIPASEQIPLFDAFSTVEMILMSFEGMHPAQLLNQILAVNFAMADFILSSSKPVYQLDLVDSALKRLSQTTEKVLKMLSKDLMEGIERRSPKITNDVDDVYSYSHITPETVTACESLCGQIGSVESLLSRVASLLTKFSGDVNLVRQVLENPGRHYAATSYESRSGILNGIQCQQQRNSGASSGAMDDLPFPSVREYILRNRDDYNPCQLTVSIGGTHGLEKGGTNSTKGGLVLALNKCVSGTN